MTEMKKTGIFYGSTTGTTKEVALKIGKLLDIDEKDIHNVADSKPSDVGAYDLLIFGSSTWGKGQLQKDWYDFIDALEVLYLKGKKVAIFGCGDETMDDTFCAAVGEIYRRLIPTECEFIAPYDGVGYEYKHTPAEVDGVIRGLILDEVNHPEATALRLRGWTDIVRAEME